MRIVRFLLALVFLAQTTAFFSQMNGFTDGLNWVSSTPVSTAQSPLFTNNNCNDIQYTITTQTSNVQFNLEEGAINGSGVIFPASASSASEISITITFNNPVTNFGMRILDLDEDNMGNQGPAEEYLYNVTPPPSSTSSLNGVNPLFIDGATITPDDNNDSYANNNTGGWIYWTGEITTLTFQYHRDGSGYEFVLDSLHFDCPCPAPADYINDTLICQNTPALLDASTQGATYEWSNGSDAAFIQPTAPGMYWVAVNIGGCIDRDTAVISTITVPDMNLGNDTAICEGATITWNVPSVFGSAVWQDGSSATSYSTHLSGTYYATTSYNSCQVSDTVSLLVIPYPEVDLGNDTIICESSALIIDAGNPGSTFQWSNGAVTQQISVSGAGNLWVIVSNGSCSSNDTISISLKPLPENPLPNDTIICTDDELSVVLTSPGNLSFEWYNGSTEDHITVNSAGSYWVESTLNGCQRTDTLSISEYPVISELDFDSSMVICEGKSTLIGPTLNSPLISIEWDNGMTSSPRSINDAGIYHFTVSTPCESYDYSVEIKEEQCYCSVYLPNAFTPDNKNANEVFAAKYDCPIDRFELLIFDRWGEIVFSTTDPDASWDGTYKGSIVQDGVYIYRLVYISAETQTYKELTGHVSVLR